MKNFLTLLFLTPFLAQAQYELYNGGAIYAQKGALVHVQGTFTNASSSSAYQNNGILELEGDLVNSGTATFTVDTTVSSTDRAVKFVGTGTQHISGNLSTAGSQSIYNIVIDQKTASDTVEMETNAVVEGSLVFGHSNTTTTYNPSITGTTNNNDGLLKTYISATDTTQQYTVNITNSDVDAIAGYPSLTINGNPNTGFVLTQGTRGNEGGGLLRAVSSTSSYVFPVGTSAHGYQAARLNFTSVTGGPQSIISKFCDGTSNPTGYVGTLSQYCVGCGSSSPDNDGYNRFFTQDPCNGNNPQWVNLQESIKDHGYWSITSTTNNSAYQYWLEVFPNSYTDLGNPTDTWRLLKYHEPGNTSALSEYGFDPTTADWTAQIESSISNVDDLLTYTKNTGCYSGSGIPGGLYSGFSHFSMFSSHSNNALPVTLLNLTATPINNQYIQVAWNTAIEVNNAGFDVMRSTDGVSFTKVGWVAGHDNSTVMQSYSDNDYNVEPNIVYYYKLHQVDNNGQFKESNVVYASLNGSGTFSVSDFVPNPTRNQSMINVTTSSTQNIEVKVYDMLGREMSQRSYALTAGTNSIYFDVQGLADATYTAVIFAENKVYSKKLVISRN